MASLPAPAPPTPTTPAGMPPPGVIPNYENPESRAYEAVAAGAVIMSIMLIFVFMKVYARAAVTKTLGSDDCKTFGTELFI